MRYVDVIAKKINYTLYSFSIEEVAFERQQGEPYILITGDKFLTAVLCLMLLLRI